MFVVDPPSRQGTLAAPFPPPRSVTGHSPASQVRRGAATGAGQPSGLECLSSLPPPASPGWAHTSSFLCGCVFPDPRLRPGCLCSAQRSSWLLTASCCLGLRFFVVGRPGDSSVKLLGGGRSSGEPVPLLCPEGIPAGRASCRLPVPAPCPEVCPPVPPPLPLLPPGWCGLGLGCELMKEEGDSHVPWQG